MSNANMTKALDIVEWWFGALWLPFVSCILLLFFAAGANT